MRDPVESTVLIIGGGPAGLSLAHECQKRGIDVRVLEAGSAPGNSWSSMPVRLKLLSPWHQNVLFGQKWGLQDMFRLCPADEFANYLRVQSRALNLPVDCGQPVRAVRQERGTWITEASRAYRSRFVANATGYFGKPYTPLIPGNRETSVPQIHFSDYRSPDALPFAIPARGAKILVVGKRVSAGQVALDFFDAGHSVTLACRSRLEFSRPPWLQKLSYPVYFPIEDGLTKLNPFWKMDSHPPMDGGRMRKLVEGGAILTRPSIISFGSDHVVFSDNTKENFDMVIYATGFRPALDHLNSLALGHDERGLPSIRAFESTERAGLFFLGYDGINSFRSRYLRGIREDAVHLAGLMERALKDRTSP
jgi:thioredoxin reductase